MPSILALRSFRQPGIHTKFYASQSNTVKTCLKKELGGGAGEMAQQLGALPALPECPGFIVSTHMAACVYA